MEESKRIQKIRGEIIAAIPKFPNTKRTKEKLQESPLAELLLYYLSWISRFVSIRPRRVAIEPTLTRDKRWNTLKNPINNLLHKVRTGESLLPHLSSQIKSKGYTPASGEPGPGVNRWADKDFLLNAMGYHHFHLGEHINLNGQVERTNEVLFSSVCRETFIAIGIFNHSVFDFTDSKMSAERERLWSVFDRETSRSVPTGSMVVSSLIATSGHPIHVVNTAQEYARIIWDVDSKIDDPEYLKTLYQPGGLRPPIKPRFEWMLNFSDLGLHEKSQNHHIILHRGFN